MTDSGAMRHVVRIEKRAPVQDGAGEQSTTWTLVAERRAEKVATPGREFWSGQERGARVPTVFRMRNPRTFEVLPQMRLTFQGKVFDIISAVDADGRGIDLSLSCDELVNEPVA
jgi:head-tail adaptor